MNTVNKIEGLKEINKGELIMNREKLLTKLEAVNSRLERFILFPLTFILIAHWENLVVALTLFILIILSCLDIRVFKYSNRLVFHLRNIFGLISLGFIVQSTIGIISGT